MESWNMNPGADELKLRSREEIERCRSLLHGVLASGGRRTAENTLLPVNDLSLALGTACNLAGLLRSVHPDASVRAAAEESEMELSSFANSLWLDRDLFDAVSRCDVSSLDPVGRRMVEHLLRDFRRSGVDRDAAARERVRALREELVVISQAFSRNIVEDVRSIELEGPEDLDGLPQDYILEHAPGPDGKIRITTDSPDYNPFMTYARAGHRRRELYTAYRRRAPGNVAVLQSLLARRHELAEVLGYPSWAAYATEEQMARTADTVAQFIDRVSDVAAPRAEREYEILLAQKRKREPGAREVHDWEKAHYEELVRSDLFHVDSKDVRGYFEYPRVKEGILALTEDLFGIRFVPEPGAVRWHPDVEVLAVLEGGRTVGRVYLDMHPREGKFKHAAMFPLVRGKRPSGSSRGTIPEAALVCNFPNPRTSLGPALLEHSDVVTFFHEFGHLLHQLFAREQEWVRFNGISTETDFVELPSQLYEEWAWDYETLSRFAVHAVTGEKIPAGLVERMRKARDFGRGLAVRHQMFYAAVSLQSYGSDPTGLDTSRLVKDLQERYSPFRFVDGTYFQASFGHLDEYSALYYTYMWSLVIEKDIFQELRKQGVMSREAAARYRDCILRPGGSADAADLVASFLGRAYSFAAFEAWLNGG